MSGFKDIFRRPFVLFTVGLITVSVVIAATWAFFNFNKSSESDFTQKKETSRTKDLGDGISVEFFDSSYEVATSRPTGWFKTGQEADIMLSGVDFGRSGGPLLFNHPKGIATDGKRLLLADTYNNRILVWNKLPGGNEKPDLVLGQDNFTTNNPGTGLGEFNWPVAVATDGKHVLVADTENDRILIWNSFPTKNGQKADLVLEGFEEQGIDKRGNILWPWAVWTDGEKAVVTSTQGSQVLIWNSFPTKNNQPADIILKLKDFGTPRSVGSDGKHLMVGDHNARGSGSGNFFWKSFPTKNDQNYDFFIADPSTIGQKQAVQPGEGPPMVHGVVLWSDFTQDGKFLTFGTQPYIWNSFPKDENDAPDLGLGSKSPVDKGYSFQGGDGSGLAVAGDKMYLSLSNGNKIVGFNSLPTKSGQSPDFAIGAADINTNTLETNFFITNPVPATDGKSLFVSSDFDRKLYLWKNLPDESGAGPDIIYTLPDGAWDNSLFGQKLVLAGHDTVYIWKKLPSGEKPDVILKGLIGNVKLQDIKGVALDGKYFYLADSGANKVYVWEGVPDKNSNPKFSINVNQPWRLSSDGKYLVVDTIFDQSIKIYQVDNLSADSKPSVVKGPAGSKVEPKREASNFNLPQMSIVSGGHLFIADNGFNRVLAWKKIEDATASKAADVILGAKNLTEITPQIGKDKVFWPAGLAFDGSYLWVGEFKFSGRILRFSVR